MMPCEITSPNYEFLYRNIFTRIFTEINFLNRSPKLECSIIPKHSHIFCILNFPRVTVTAQMPSDLSTPRQLTSTNVFKKCSTQIFLFIFEARRSGPRANKKAKYKLIAWPIIRRRLGTRRMSYNTVVPVYLSQDVTSCCGIVFGPGEVSARLPWHSALTALFCFRSVGGKLL